MKIRTNLRLKKAGRRGEAGFTLLETAVAAMIMLVGLLSAAQLFVLAALYNNSSKQTTLATSLAHRKLEELLAQPIDSALLAYGGSLTSNATVGSTNYFESYFVDPTTKQVRNTAWFTGQPATYLVRWSVSADPGTPQMAGLRVISVRAEASRAGLVGGGAGSTNAAKEVAELTTIRTPPQ
jgi:Tfp pilus assembly protein PilV